MYAIPTAMTAPARGPATYAHQSVRSPPTSAGPSERAGFIDAPVTGAAHKPARLMYPATASP